MSEKKIRAVSYERVSTDLQAQRNSILAQADQLDARLTTDPERIFLRRYQDEAFSGSLDLHDRPQGRRLLEDAMSGKFDEVWVFKTDRLGRDDIDPHVVKRTLERHGVRLRSLHDNVDSPLEYAIKVAFAAEERRNIQLRTRAGMRAAASRGRYIGGPPPYGYRVEEHADGHVYLAIDNEVVWGDWTAADIARRIFAYLALDRRSARKIAAEFNSLGIPTSYARLSRGVRGKKTRNRWTAGRILQVVKNSVYKGKPTFGKKPNDKHWNGETFYGNCPALVAEELWQAAQEALQANRLMAKNTTHVSLLRSVIKCGLCGLTFCTTQGRGEIRWYRCNGYLAERGGKDARCQAKAIKSTVIEPVVWRDVERYLRDPGEVLAELAGEGAQDNSAALAAAERITLEAALRGLGDRRTNALDMREHTFIDDVELAVRLANIAAERIAIEEKLGTLQEAGPTEEPLDEDLLAAVRARLDAGLNDEQRQEIAQLLVRKITVHTIQEEDRKKARVVIEYRFTPPVVVSTDDGRGSSRRRA